MRRILLTLAVSLATLPAVAAIQQAPLEWASGDKTFSGVLVYDDVGKARPGVLMVPNWMGVTDAAIAQAREVAGAGYVVLVADMYGKGIRPADSDEARKQVQAVFADGGVTARQRAGDALAALRGQAGRLPLDAGRVAAIGYCFGGTVALEIARAGADVDGVVSFHGGLGSPAPAGAQSPVATSILVLNGADDTSVPDEAILAFEQEMDAAGADWQLVNFSGAAHCFTHPEDAGKTGNCRYDARSARRAFEMMRDFLGERFQAPGG
ncbi:dienelactone hydrolase family protein [Marilutibacter spongiae]|uniref:Dienelactone hydrolase family protein n=1 Tax=Marilutibacter spongiae TaxID=2025720 RepID=A0A7W3Y5S9_9GAMM|nr:dienelactone hydrolase family protein [Lysobacter spongiae]MBB1060300.1 dienelactone hydrolase family protein [Lysobacter spongiae]